jgi:hypothetical protein
MLDALLAPEHAVSTEPIIGWRTWTLAGSRAGGAVRLLPIAGTEKPWPPMASVRAECARGRGHDVPGPACTCGIHATHTTDPLRRTRDPAVLGTVALWGRVLEHELGYRAELGYPQRLALICPLCFWQWGPNGSERPVVVARRRNGRMVPLCDAHLQLCTRYGYPLRRLFDARAVERALLDTYAVDVCRSIAAPYAASRPERRSGYSGG